jgi:hypothetical protein
MNRFRAIPLQRLDDLLSRQQRSGLFLEPLDFLQLLVEDGDFPLQEIVALILRRYVAADDGVNKEQSVQKTAGAVPYVSARGAAGG